MTLQSNDPAAALAAGNEALRLLAVGEGMGTAAIGEYFVTVAEQIGAGIRDYADTGALYVWRFDVLNAEENRRGRELTKRPEGNSLASQLTKARTITALGTCELLRTGTIACLRSVAARPVCAWAYKPLCVAAKAITDTLASEPNATDERLMDAAQEAMDNMPTKAPKTLESELTKLVKSFDKLVGGDAFGGDVARADKRAGENLSGAAGKALVRLLNAAKAVAADDALNA